MDETSRGYPRGWRGNKSRAYGYVYNKNENETVLHTEKKQESVYGSDNGNNNKKRAGGALKKTKKKTNLKVCTSASIKK